MGSWAKGILFEHRSDNLLSLDRHVSLGLLTCRIDSVVLTDMGYFSQRRSVRIQILHWFSERENCLLFGSYELILLFISG